MLFEALPKGSKILLLDKDYPSINWAAEQRDFEFCFAKVNEDLERNIEEAVQENQPDVFAFSLVQYLSGIKIDQQFLKQLKAYHPRLLLIADGTQYLGTEAFSFSESAIDILGSSTYKWLLAGYGNAFLMLKDGVEDRINSNVIGFNSAEGNYSNRQEISLIQQFEPGHLDTLNFGSLKFSLEWMNNYGLNNIFQKNNILKLKAKEAFMELGLLEKAVAEREEHSTIYNLNGGDELFQKLTEKKIVCSQRAAGIRVGFHFYNSEEDLEKLISVIREAK